MAEGTNGTSNGQTGEDRNGRRNGTTTGGLVTFDSRRDGTGLTRSRIVKAAIGYVDSNGLQGLTMRDLGGILNVEAMALYRYLNGREDLLEGIVAELLADVYSRVAGQVMPTWQAFLQYSAHELRRVALEHPNAFPLLATRHPAASWLRPPLRSVQLLNTFLVELGRRGLPDADVAVVYRAFSSFLLGQLLLEASVRGADTSPPDEPLNEGDADIPTGDSQVDLSDAPAVARLRPLLRQPRQARLLGPRRHHLARPSGPATIQNRPRLHRLEPPPSTIAARSSRHCHDGGDHCGVDHVLMFVSVVTFVRVTLSFTT